jgi:hypothetical protein
MKHLLFVFAITVVAFCTPGARGNAPVESKTSSDPLPPPDKPASTTADEPKSKPPLPPQSAPGSAGGKLQPAAPVLIPPQNAAPQNAAPADNAAAKKNPGKPPEFFAARRQAQIARREAAKQRMRDYQAARFAHDQKMYEDWHERYLADTPVRVEYYRALADAYEASAAASYERAAFFNSFYPPMYFPPAPYFPYYFGPAYAAPVYGTVFIGW